MGGHCSQQDDVPDLGDDTHLHVPFDEDNRPQRLVALAGNPNVGKSTLFNAITGREVLTAHYPGKTACVNLGDTLLGEQAVTVADLPGVYALHGEADDQVTVRKTLLESPPDAVLIVMDSTNVARNVYLALQLLDLGLPCVIALNLADEATRLGLNIDHNRLAELLGVPALPVVATQGTGVEEVLDLALAVARGGRREPLHRYGDRFEAALAPVTRACKALRERPWGLGARSLALALVEGSASAERETASLPGGEEVMRVLEGCRSMLATSGDEASVSIARERYGAAGLISEQTVERGDPSKPLLGARVWAWTTFAVTGVPILVAVLAAVFGFLFFVGDFLARAVSSTWQAVASPLVRIAVERVLGEGVAGRTALWGLDAGIEASLAIGIPYILTFYVLLSLLEDTGYLNSVAFLADRALHRVGLHGRAIIPLVAAAGCNVPAIIATRSLPTARERTIAAALATTVPCSARTAVVLGAVAHYIGWGPAAGVFGVTFLVTVGIGIALDRLLPGHSTGMVMEMFPFRKPSLKAVFRKAWTHFREFLLVATPIVIVGSVILGGLYESGLLWNLTAPLEPVVSGWLMLPSVAGLTLLVALIRKELALQLLITFAVSTIGESGHNLLAFMTSTQLFVYALVNTLAFPCISTLAVLAREIGVPRSAIVVATTVSVAVLLGGVAARLAPTLGFA